MILTSEVVFRYFLEIHSVPSTLSMFLYIFEALVAVFSKQKSMYQLMHIEDAMVAGPVLWNFFRIFRKMVDQ